MQEKTKILSHYQIMTMLKFKLEFYLKITPLCSKKINEIIVILSKIPSWTYQPILYLYPYRSRCKIWNRSQYMTLCPNFTVIGHILKFYYNYVNYELFVPR